LKVLYQQQKESDNHASKYLENVFGSIYELGCSFIALMDNKYFLPGKDPKVKSFFESRYHIQIGQNFERKRREPLLNEYKAVFFEYQF
jgi:hypothetical protein